MRTSGAAQAEFCSLPPSIKQRSTMEIKMNISTKISAALAVAAISAAFMGYSGSANAAGQLRDSCFGKTRGAVENCCQKWVRTHGKPQWMLSSRDGCAAAAVCSSGGSNYPAIAYVQKPNCFIEQTLPEEKEGKGPPPSSRQTGKN